MCDGKVSMDGWPCEPEPRDALPLSHGNSAAVAEDETLLLNKRLGRQMVQMGEIVGGRSVRMDLPYHVREDDEQND